MIPTIEPVERAGEDGVEELVAVEVPVDFSDVEVPLDVSVPVMLDDADPSPFTAEVADNEVAVGVKSAGFHRI